MEYKKGDEVEVISNEAGFEGSYYNVFIVTKLEDEEYIVTYRTFLKEDLSGPLREVVTAKDLRPAPPAVTTMAFRLDETVDAFHNDGWWVGKVIGRIDSVYNLFFESTGEKLPYRIDQMRVHQDWVGGWWITRSPT